jgi:pre-mRNA-splicing factor CWC22
VENYDSVQNYNINTKHDSQEDTVTNNSSSQQKRTVDLLTSRTGGAYIPPAKLRMMQARITEKSGAVYQRIALEALKKSIHGHIKTQFN